MKEAENMINITHLRLRMYLGILGIALPFILIFGNKLDIQPSISDFYFTRMSVIFTGILFAFGLFLLSYGGYKKEKNELSDNWLTNVAGVMAILTAIIPTASTDHEYFAPFCSNGEVCGILHLIFAATFFIIMGWMSLFRFTKTNPNIKKTISQIKLKERRNSMYRISGIIVWASIFFLFIEMCFKFNFTGKDIFIGETVALEFFGVAWLVKSKALGETKTKMLTLVKKITSKNFWYQKKGKS